MKAIKYNINLTKEDLDNICKLSEHMTDSTPLLRRKDQHLNTKPKYTIARTKSNRFILIGNGRKEIAKTEEGEPVYIENAFLGQGATGRVKVGMELVKQGQSLQLDETNSFAVKIYRYKGLEPLHIQEISTTANKEAEIYTRMYGMSEMINSTDRQKFILIIPNLGVPLNTMDYTHMTIEVFAELFVSGLYSLLTLHRLNYRHTDIHLDNFLFDDKNQVVNIIDFSYCDRIENAEDRDMVEFEKLKYISVTFKELLTLFCNAHQPCNYNSFPNFFDENIFQHRINNACADLLALYKTVINDLVKNPIETCILLLNKLKGILHTQLGQKNFIDKVSNAWLMPSITSR